MRVGELQDAAEIIDSGLRELRPTARENRTAAALTGAYELKAALTAARAGDTATTWARWERARTVADEIGRDLNEPLEFGPSNVAIWSVALPVEMLHGAEAVNRAGQVNPFLGTLIPAATIGPGRYSRERLSRHWIDVGRAYYYRADRDRALTAHPASGADRAAEDQDQPGRPGKSSATCSAPAARTTSSNWPCAWASPEPRKLESSAGPRDPLPVGRSIHGRPIRLSRSL